MIAMISESHCTVTFASGTHQVFEDGGEEALELGGSEGLVRVDVDLAYEGGVLGVLSRYSVTLDFTQVLPNTT